MSIFANGHLVNGASGGGGMDPLPDGEIFVGDATNVAVAVAMSGEATIANTGAVTLSNSAVIGKVLTGYTAGAGTVSATDTILQGIQKIDGNFTLVPLLAGRAGGQILYGGTAASNDLTLKSTSNATKGRVVIEESTSLSLFPYGTGAGETQEIRFRELAANGTNYISLKAPDNIAANRVNIWPTAAPANGQVLKHDGSTQLAWVYDNVGLFGTGVDGDVTISSNTTLSGPMHANNLTIDSTFFLTSANYPIYVRGTLTVNGTIRVLANNGAAGGGSGTAQPTTFYAGSSSGGAGGTAAGSASTSLTNAVGTVGGTGGTGSSGAGAAAGTVTTPAMSSGGVNLNRTIFGMFSPMIQSATTKWSISSGGGGGGGDGAVAGGGGGGGGGTIMIFAKMIAGSGDLSCPGGNGGSPLSGNSGGGGGGAGGFIGVCSTTGLGSVTTNVTGGTGGTGSGTGTNGANGSAGVTFSLIMQG